MVLLSELIYNIKNLRGAGSQSDDMQISDAQFEFIINHFRAEIASQRITAKKSVKGFTQELHNLRLISTRDFRPADRSVAALRSQKQIPTVIDVKDGYLVDFIGTRDEFYPFQKSGVNDFNLALTNKFLRNLYFIESEYIYVMTKNRNGLREAYFSAVFGDPREAAQFDSGEPVIGYDWEYPLPSNLVGQLNNLIINNEFRWAHLLPADETNDGTDGD